MDILSVPCVELEWIDVHYKADLVGSTRRIEFDKNKSDVKSIWYYPATNRLRVLHDDYTTVVNLDRADYYDYRHYVPTKTETKE